MFHVLIVLLFPAGSTPTLALARKPLTRVKLLGTVWDRRLLSIGYFWSRGRFQSAEMSIRERVI
jgi:hypothetical protein